jgi:hypothetical protein
MQLLYLTAPVHAIPMATDWFDAKFTTKIDSICNFSISGYFCIDRGHEEDYSSLHKLDASKSIGNLTNEGARLYYNSKLPTIGNAIERWEGRGLSAQSISEKASSLRNTLKLRTRNLMADQATAKSLPPIRPYQYYLDKYSAEGLSGDALYNRIIKGSLTPNPGVNAAFGIQ